VERACRTPSIVSKPVTYGNLGGSNVGWGSAAMVK
jgi:hypothetical protein